MALLLGIGLVDLVVTAVLHSQGHIVELNPLMRYFIEKSEFLFAAVKGATLIGSYWVMHRYCEVNRGFVQKACLIGSAVYLFIWCSWFFSSM